MERGQYLERNLDGAVDLDAQQTNNEDTAMDKDRIRLGRASQGSGETDRREDFGDKKLETEGKADKAAGKVQNAVEGGPYVSVGARPSRPKVSGAAV